MLSMFAVAAVVILLVRRALRRVAGRDRDRVRGERVPARPVAGPLASERRSCWWWRLYAWRLKTSEALTAVVSSKINQWTLLVGTLPLVFAIASGGLHGLPVGTAQREEVLLTAAQTVFAVAILVNLSHLPARGVRPVRAVLGAVHPRGSGAAVLQGHRAAGAVGGLHPARGVAAGPGDAADFRHLLRDGFRTPYSELEPEAAAEGRVAALRSRRRRSGPRTAYMASSCRPSNQVDSPPG